MAVGVGFWLVFALAIVLRFTRTTGYPPQLQAAFGNSGLGRRHWTTGAFAAAANWPAVVDAIR